jgi:hypothetical protein
MNQELFEQFLKSEDTLRIYRGSERVFSSNKGMLFPLLEYIASSTGDSQNIVVLDKVVGNAAALLAVKAGAAEVYSPLGSEMAVKTLHLHKVICHLDKVVPYILAANGKDLCPMEKLSIDKSPEELYRALQK